MNNHTKTQLILASNSPRRRELLTQIGIGYEIITKDVDENLPISEPKKLVLELSQRKATAAAEGLQTDRLQNITVLGADTIVSHHGNILGKPKDQEHAFQMIRSLSGATHQVYTGVTLLHFSSSVHIPSETVRFFACTDVTVFPMSDQEIRAYVATGDPMDKAGAYGIQGPFAAYVKGIRGDYNNVVGLPVSRVYQELKKRGWLA